MSYFVYFQLRHKFNTCIYSKLAGLESEDTGWKTVQLTDGNLTNKTLYYRVLNRQLHIYFCATFTYATISTVVGLPSNIFNRLSPIYQDGIVKYIYKDTNVTLIVNTNYPNNLYLQLHNPNSSGLSNLYINIISPLK